MSVIRSRDNPRVRRWAALAADGRLRRKERRALIEGPHLVQACLDAGIAPIAVVVSESALARGDVARLCGTPTVVSDAVFRKIADAETPQGIAAEIEIPSPAPRRGDSVFLEGVQDPANVGAIIRSAAAFAVGTVIVNPACADPWSPKALRAGQGGHFRVVLREADAPGEGRVICTVARGGVPLKTADLSGRLCWVFGSEGRGVSQPMLERAALRLTISTEPHVESLNVAAAAALCLHEAYTRR